jgi:hypothetical protein
MSKTSSADLTGFRDELAGALAHLRRALALAPPPGADLRELERLLDGLWLAACVAVRFSNPHSDKP